MILVVVFDPADEPSAGRYAAAVGAEFDILRVPQDGAPADAVAQDIAGRIAGYDMIAAASSMASKDVIARAAGLVDAAMVSDVVALSGPNRFQRPLFAGAIVATVEASGSPVFVTFRPAGFSGEAASPRNCLSATPGESRVKRLSASAKKGDRPDLAQAKRVVSGGKPLKDSETFERVIGGLADAIGGAVGATRAAVDTGIAANELQVGQTGKVVAPDLYIAAGISGSTQHVAGIKDSKVIVAINKDKDAPIFEVADLGLVADLFDAVPELTAKIKA